MTAGGPRRRALRRTISLGLFAAGLSMSPGAASAQALDPTSAAALAETLRILGDPAARSAGGAGAKGVESQVQSLAGSPEATQEVYTLAGQVFADLVKSTGGDTGKLLEALQRAQSDPSSLTEALSPATLQRLRELSTKISDQKR